jgi:hypothetical protein
MCGIGNWVQYRRMRIAWWLLTLAAAASVAFGAAGISLGLWMFWAAFSALAAFWPCPRCNQRVGVINTKLIAMLVPFGGWCVACGTRLFGNKTRANGS